MSGLPPPPQPFIIEYEYKTQKNAPAPGRRSFPLTNANEKTHWELEPQEIRANQRERRVPRWRKVIGKRANPAFSNYVARGLAPALNLANTGVSTKFVNMGTHFKPITREPEPPASAIVPPVAGANNAVMTGLSAAMGALGMSGKGRRKTRRTKQTRRRKHTRRH